MDGNMEETLRKYFSDMQEKIEDDIKNIKRNIPNPYGLSYILRISQKEIEKIFSTYGIENAENIAREISIYKQISEYKDEIKKSFIVHLTQLEQKISSYIDKLNTIVNNIAKEQQDKIILLSEQIDKIQNITSIIFSDKKELTVDDYENIIEIILTLNIPDEEKLLLSQHIVLCISKKQKEHDDEKKSEINNIKQIADEIYERFFKTDIELGIFADIKDAEEIFSLEELETLAEGKYSLETFAHSILMLIKSIKTETDINKAKELTDKLNSLIEMYDTYKKLKNEIEDIKEKLNQIYTSGNTYLSKEEYAEIYTYIYNDIPELHITNNDELEEKVNSIKTQLEQAIEYAKSKIQTKAFVILPYNNGELFFIDDIIGQKMIDKSTRAYTDGSYVKGISQMLYQILVHGKVDILDSINTSAQNYSGKIISQVCNYDSKNQVNRNDKTDMWRIRPIRNSELRYVEKQIILKVGTPIYSQVINLLKKHMRGISIDENEDFILSINYCLGVKKEDKDLYRTAINRRNSYEGDKINQVLSKNELSDEELQFVDELIISSLEAYNTIRQVDPRYNFDYIDKMIGEGGRKHDK